MGYQGKRSNGSSNKPVWLLYVLAGIALLLAVFVLFRYFSSDKPQDHTPPDVSDPSVGDSSNQPSGGDTQTPDANASAQGRADLLAQASTLSAGYFYDEALALIASKPELANDETAAMTVQIENLKASLVEYTSTQFYHVFFHSLIVDNSKAFDGDIDSNGYNLYMTTVSEFQKMLPLLHENGFVLYDITQMMEMKDGKAVQKPIYLPAGKKPLVLSIDDVNYYEYMKGDGFAERLDVDEQGNVVTMVLDENGVEQATYDGDVMPILDAYVKENPDFSFRGAKGIVAVTGYQGAFGYRITDLPDYDADTQKYMLDKVTEVAQALRSTGWQIANHSYTHNQYWTKKTMTMDQLKYDTGRWLGEIAPYVGETNILISPFGVLYGQDDERFRYIVNNGFTIYCPVGSSMSTTWQGDNMLQDRLNLDGITMLKYPERIKKHFFDPALVLDPARPPLK